LPYRVAAHVPEVAEVREEWRRLHHRPPASGPGVGFYSCACATPYGPTPHTAADALTAHALATVDFARTIAQAWVDGVRVFIEHGPRGLCTRWVSSTLGERDHLAVALDPVPGDDINQLAQVAAELVAAGVAIDTGALFEHLSACWPPGKRSGHDLSVPAHPSPLRLPAVAPADRNMPPAPPLAPTQPEALNPTGPEHVPAGRNGHRAAAVEQYRHVAILHQDFLTRQAEVHQLFLATSRQAQALLVGGRLDNTRERTAAPAAPRRDKAPAEGHRPGPSFDRAQL